MRIQILVTLLVLGCSESLNGPATPGTRVDVHRFRTDAPTFNQFSAINQSERLVIRDAAAWSAVWAEIAPNAGGPPPAIDFGSQSVVLAALGSRPDAGYLVRVDSAAVDANVLTIWIATITTGSGCASATVITHPADIAWIPRFDGAVHFVDVPQVASCP